MLFRSIIHDLVKIYSSIGSDCKIKEDIAKTKISINEILKKKDKLLDLSIKGHLSDEEFEKRNRQFNLDVDSLEARVANLEEEEQKNKEISLTVETLRKMIADELDFNEGFDNAIIDTLLDRIVVYKSDNKNVINLKVFFKVLNEEMKYKITRGRNASVCSEQYKCMRQKKPTMTAFRYRSKKMEMAGQGRTLS